MTTVNEKPRATAGQIFEAKQTIDTYLQNHADKENSILEIMYRFGNDKYGLSADAVFDACFLLKNLIRFFLVPEHLAAFMAMSKGPQSTLSETLPKMFELFTDLQEEPAYVEVLQHQLNHYSHSITASDAASTIRFVGRLNAIAAASKEASENLK